MHLFCKCQIPVLTMTSPGTFSKPIWHVMLRTGDLFHPEFEIGDNDVTLSALAPCQSLGAFYVSPTPASQRFLEALAHWIMYT